MSIHKSKGLQFPVVFLCDTNGGGRNDIDKIVVDDNGNIGVDMNRRKFESKVTNYCKKTYKEKEQTGGYGGEA